MISKTPLIGCAILFRPPAPRQGLTSGRTKCFLPALLLRVNATNNSRRIASERFGWSSPDFHRGEQCTLPRHTHQRS
jgi:hypothetical protein